MRHNYYFCLLALLAGLLVASRPLRAQALLFAPPGLYATGDSTAPQRFVVADLNGDAVPDIGTVNTLGSSVSILLGTGYGTFQPAVTYSSGAKDQPLGIVAGDANGDGYLDLFVANSFSYTIGILLGKGDGTFQPVRTTDCGYASYSNGLAKGDVNGDGHLDLLTANFGTNKAGVLLGRGDGTFQAPLQFDAGSSGFPSDIVAADVSGDGKADLVVDNANTSAIGVLLGNGDGTFQPVSNYPTGDNSVPRGISAADVNQDGHPDILVANTNSNAAGVLLGKGDGTFQPIRIIPLGQWVRPFAVSVADLDGNGRLDLLLANTTTDKVIWLPGNGDGTFQAPVPFSIGADCFSAYVVAADVDGDGAADLLASSPTTNSIRVLLRAELPTLTAVVPASAAVGTSVTLTGTHLSSATNVRFGSVAATFAGRSATTITAVVPVGASSNLVTVTTSGGTSAGIPFAVQATALPTRAALPGTSATLYPNPARTAATLTLAGLPATAALAQATLLDAVGRVVGRHLLATTGGTLPLAGLAPGLYAVRLAALGAAGQVLGELPMQRLGVE